MPTLVHKIWKKLRKIRHLKKFLLGYGIENPSQNGEYLFIRQKLKNAKVIFDAGVFVVDHVDQYFAQNSICQVHGFEPIPESYAIAKRRFAKEEGKRFFLNHVALSDQPGKLILHSYQGVSSFYKNQFHVDNPDSREVEVSAITIDDYVAQNNISHIDFIKLDVEGYELNVLRGAIRCLQDKKIAQVQFEFAMNQDYSFKNIYDFFQQLGYTKIYRLAPYGLFPIGKYHPKNEKRTGNYLATYSA